MPATPPPLSVSQLVLQAKRQEIEAVRQLAGRAELVDVIGQVIHLLQRERGASSTYLASRGQRFDQVRRSCVDEAVPVATRLRHLFADQMSPGAGAGARLLSMMAWVLLGLEALDDLRAQIGRQALSAHDAVAAFSRLIAGLVDLIVLVADAALLPAISRQLVAFLHLVQGKEAAGQERALGALLFASGLCTDAHQQRVIHLIDAQERSLTVFCEFAEPSLRERFEQQQLAPAVARLERMRRTLCAARTGGTLNSGLSEAWFEVSSERIGGLWQLEIALVAEMRAACDASLQDAEAQLQDSEGLLRRLRDHPPAHAHAVDRFFDTAISPQAVPALTAAHGAAPTASLVELLQAQAAQLSGMEAELGIARRALHERKVIDRAKGLLMARMGMTEEGALRALQKTSMDQNRRLVDVAEATLALPDFAFGAAPARRSA